MILRHFEQPITANPVNSGIDGTLANIFAVQPYEGLGGADEFRQIYIFKHHCY